MREYKKANIPLAKNLRKNMTKWEKKLWYDFLSSYPVRFQRQKAIGDYIVDFYCARAHIGIELDGRWHREVQISDRERTEQLNFLGIHIYRISNKEIDCGFSEVCRKIDFLVQQALPPDNAL